MAPVALQQTPLASLLKPAGYIFVTVDKKQVKILFAEILFIESQKDYLKIVMKNKTLVTRQTMHEMEQLLPVDQFIRSHRSYIVSKVAIEKWDATEIEINGQLLPIGRNYREEVLKLLKQ